MSQPERIVIAGAGLSGLRAAERLRELGFEGEVVIIGAESLPPYHRPALSKQLLNGTMRPNDLMLPAYRDVAASWRLGTQIAYLSPRDHALHLPGGEEVRYDGLIIATGVEARRPNGVPYHDPRIMLMRNMPDALDLERALTASRGPVAVIGGGFTGCEIAASLRHMGRDVTIIGRGKNLLGNVLGPKLGEWLTKQHRSHGVDLALGNSVKQWRPGPDGIGLRLSDGTTMVASCVVIAAGSVPSTTWLRGSGLPLDDGVVCDATCHVVGAEDVVAAGDVAQWPNLRFDEVPRRIEHWLNAIEMGRAAAESLLDGRGSAKPFTPMPRFWTEQYGVRIQAGGVPRLGTDTITLGTPDDGSGTVVGFVREGRLMGVVGVDCPSSVLAWTETVAEQNPVPGEERAPAREEQPVIPAPALAGAGPATAGADTRRKSSGGGRHALPPPPKPNRPVETSSRPAAATASARMSPVLPADSSSRIAPVPPMGSSTHLRPVVPGGRGPADSNGRMQPVNGRPLPNGRGPVDSNGRMRPVPLPNGRGPAESNGRMFPVPPPNGRGPAESNTRMRPAPPPNGRGPADSNGRMYPVPPPNGRGPAESNTRMPIMPPPSGRGPVDSNGRMFPVPPPNGRGPADSNGRMFPVPPPNGRGPAESNGRIFPVPPPNGRPGDSVMRMSPVPPPPPNGRGPADSNGRMRPVGNGRPVPPPPNGRPAPMESNTRMRPVPPPNARPGPAESSSRMGPPNGRGPADSNGRMRPVVPNGRGPADSNGRMQPVPPPNGRGPAESSSRLPMAPVPVRNSDLTGWIPTVAADGPFAPVSTNGRPPNARPVPMEATSWIPAIRPDDPLEQLYRRSN